MKVQYVPIGRMSEHVPAHPERTGYRNVRVGIGSPHWGDIEVRTFPNRAAMLKCIELQERGADWNNAFRPWPIVNAETRN